MFASAMADVDADPANVRRLQAMDRAVDPDATARSVFSAITCNEDAVPPRPELVTDALTTIAAQRAAHAEALSEEIVRLTGHAAPTPSTAAASTTTTSAASVPDPTVDDVIGALRASADSATAAAGSLTGYRAGLLASIAASCTASFTVALAGAGSTP